MTLAELARLRNSTLAEVSLAEQMSAQSPYGSREQRIAAKDLDRLSRRLAELEVKRARLPSRRGHPAGCWCEECTNTPPKAFRHAPDCTCPLCQRLAEQGRVGGESVIYNLKVPPELRDRLREIGAARVREALEQLAKEA